MLDYQTKLNEQLKLRTYVILLMNQGLWRRGQKSNLLYKIMKFQKLNNLDLYPNEPASLVGWRRSNFKYDFDLVRPPS